MKIKLDADGYLEFERDRGWIPQMCAFYPGADMACKYCGDWCPHVRLGMISDGRGAVQRTLFLCDGTIYPLGLGDLVVEGKTKQPEGAKK